jgi:hypothetical protein
VEQEQMSSIYLRGRGTFGTGELSEIVGIQEAKRIKGIKNRELRRSRMRAAFVLLEKSQHLARQSNERKKIGSVFYDFDLYSSKTLASILSSMEFSLRMKVPISRANVVALTTRWMRLEKSKVILKHLLGGNEELQAKLALENNQKLIALNCACVHSWTKIQRLLKKAENQIEEYKKKKEIYRSAKPGKRLPKSLGKSILRIMDSGRRKSKLLETLRDSKYGEIPIEISEIIFIFSGHVIFVEVEMEPGSIIRHKVRTNLHENRALNYFDILIDEFCC